MNTAHSSKTDTNIFEKQLKVLNYLLKYDNNENYFFTATSYYPEEWTDFLYG